MNTLKTGALGLSRAIYEYERLGYTVLLPLIDSQHYDLAVEKDGRFFKVQCRTTNQKTRTAKGPSDHRYDVSLRNIKTNTKKTVSRKRKKGDYDLLFVLCGNDVCYSIPAKELPTSGTTVGGPKYKKYEIRD